MHLRSSRDPRRAVLPKLLQGSWNWRRHGRCLDYSPDTFFPDDFHLEPRERRSRENKAKTICRTCPVLTECREYATTLPELHGIWGATTPQEREMFRSAV